jgi:hypothetical protein|tara:strand:- start:310 stop:813 length:504 start_codon:yes stop_codon:yes gene_type:complete
MPKNPTRISTAAYAACFKKFRNAHYKNGKWNKVGTDFLESLNKAIVEYQNAEADTPEEAAAAVALVLVKVDRDDFDKVVSKHTQTRAKVRKDYRKALNAEFGVENVSGRGATENLSGLSDAHRASYLKKKAEFTSLIGEKMPSLPSFDGTRKARKTLTGQQIMGILD